MASAVVGALRVLLDVDASPLHEGFGKATITIGNFDKLTQNAGRNLQRMVEGFSGQRIVAEATTMVAALEKIGGTAGLTERELRRVAGTVNEATAKLRAMGVEVPPSIAKIKGEIDALGMASQKTGGFFATLGKAGAALGPLLPITSVVGLTTALVRLGSQAFESAGHIVDLSNKTGLSTRTIQEMRAVAGQTGTTVDAFTDSVFKLGINIANGTTKARDAVNSLGLSFAELERMAPEEQFNRIIRALEEEENVGKRNAAGRALFGAQWAQIAASVEEGYFKIADAAAKSSDAQLKALDAAGDAWDRFTNTLNSTVVSALGNVALAFEGVVAAFTKLEKIDLLQIIGAAMSAGVSPEQMLMAMGRAFAETADGAAKAAPAVDGAARATASYAEQLQAARRSLLDLLPAQRDEIDAAIKLKTSNEEIADQFNLSQEAVQLYRDQMEKVPASTKKVKDAVEQAARVQRDYNNWIGVRYIEAEGDRQAAAAKSERQLRDFYNWLGQRRMEDDAALMNSTRLLATHTATWVPLKSAIEQTLPKLEDATQKQKRLREANRETADSLRNLAQTFGALAQIAGETGLGDTLRSIGQLITGLSLAKDGVDAVGKGFQQFKEGNFAAGFAQMASGILGVVAAMEQATRGTNKWMSALGGFATGFQVAGLGGGDFRRYSWLGARVRSPT